MAWAYVQSKAAQGGLSIAFDTTTTAGSLIVVVANTAAAAGAPTFSDGHSNTYSVPFYQSGGSARLAMGWAVNASGGALTVSMSTGAGDRGWIAAEYTGLATSPFVASVSATGAGTATDSGSCTVSQSGSLLIGASAIYNSGGFTSSAGTGFTQRLSSWSGSTWTGIALEDKTSGSSESATFTINSFTWACGAMSFKIPITGPTTYSFIGLGANK